MSKQQKADYTVTALVRVNGAIGSFSSERIVVELADPTDNAEIIAELRRNGYETNAIESVKSAYSGPDIPPKPNYREWA